MSIKVALEHRTTYRFDRPIDIGPHVVRLRPAPHTRTPIEAYSLTISPANHFINWQQDPFGNYLARVVFPEQVRRAGHHRRAGRRHGGRSTRSTSSSRTTPRRYPVLATASALRADLEPYLAPVEDAPGSASGRCSPAGWTLPLGDPDRAARPADRRLPGRAERGRVRRRRPTRSGWSTGVQTPDETLTRAIGSCRDSAWLLVAALRHFGLAARFVSGYLVQLTADAEAAGRPERPEGGLHRPARLGRGVHPRRRLDRPRPDLGPVRRRGPHPAGRHPAPAVTRRRSAGPPSRPRSSSSSPTPSPGSTRTRGSPSRTRRSR